MALPLLHPEATDDDRLLRWVTGTRQLPRQVPQLTALVDEGVLEHVEVGPTEVRTLLAPNRSWTVDGPRVRSALFEALSSLDNAAELADDELREHIEGVLEREVAPVADSHGGSVRVASVEDGVLTVELDGACRGCAQSERTVGQLVTQAVQARYPQIREVRAVKPRTVWLTLPRRRRGQ